MHYLKLSHKTHLIMPFSFLCPFHFVLFFLFVCCIRVIVFCIRIIFALESLEYAMAPLHMFNFLKYREFFSGEPNLALVSLPNVETNIQGTSNSTPSLSP